jgi:hypothetical protein
VNDTKTNADSFQLKGQKYITKKVIAEIIGLVTDTNFHEPINEEIWNGYTRFTTPPNLAVSYMIRQRLAHAMRKVLNLTENEIKSILNIIGNYQIWVQPKDITLLTVLDAIKETTTEGLVLQFLQLFLNDHNHKISQENYQKYKNAKKSSYHRYY